MSTIGIRYHPVSPSRSQGARFQGQAASESDLIERITNQQQFEALLQQSAAIPVIVMFSTTTCGPCKTAKPIFARAAERHGSNIKFAEIVIPTGKTDTLPDSFLLKLFHLYNVKSVPTFIRFKNGLVEDFRTGAPGLSNLLPDDKSLPVTLEGTTIDTVIHGTVTEKMGALKTIVSKGVATITSGYVGVSSSIEAYQSLSGRHMFLAAATVLATVVFGRQVYHYCRAAIRQFPKKPD